MHNWVLHSNLWILLCAVMISPTIVLLRIKTSQDPICKHVHKHYINMIELMHTYIVQCMILTIILVATCKNLYLNNFIMYILPRVAIHIRKITPSFSYSQILTCKTLKYLLVFSHNYTAMHNSQCSVSKQLIYN